MNSTKLPSNFRDLSEHAPLMYNMGENRHFQPVHFDFRCKVPFVILGCFSGDVNANRTIFNLSQIELALYTWDTTSDRPPLYLVSKAVVDTEKTKGKELHVNLELKLFEDTDRSSRDRRIKDGEAECKLLEEIEVHKGGRIFFHIINYDEFLKPDEIPLNTVYVSGRNCNGIPVIPGDQ